MVFLTSSSWPALPSVWRLCLCRWTARREPGRYQVPSLGKLKMFLNGGLCSGFWIQKGHLCELLYKRAQETGFDRQPAGWKTRGLVCLDRRQGEPLVEGCLERENSYKIEAPNFALVELRVWYQGEKQAKIKLIFLVLYKKMKMKNGVMGSSRPFAQKERIIVLGKN